MKDISATETFGPIERRNGVYVATFLVSEKDGLKRIATARYAKKPTEEQVQTDYAEWKAWYDKLLLDAAIEKKTDEITKYNTSENVDGFFLNRKRHWLTLDERKAAELSTKAHQTLGHETTEQYLRGQLYTIPCDTLLYILAQLEVYALACFNHGLKQKADVKAMKSVEEVEAYDVTSGYPDMLTFNL